MRKVKNIIRITPKDAWSSSEYILETDDGFFWSSDGVRSRNSLPSFLDTLRFAMGLRDVEVSLLTEADEIVGEVDAQLKGRDKNRRLSREVLIGWIDEYHSKTSQAAYANDELCDIDSDDFSEWTADQESESEAKIMIYLGAGR